MLVEMNVKKENEKKKEYLWRYRDALKSQHAIEQEIEQLRLDKMCPRALQNDGMPHGSGCSDLSEYAAKVDELMHDLQEQMKKKIDIRWEITRKIDAMPNETESLLLRYRYIYLLKWEEVALKMEYSWRNVMKLHGKALEHFKI